MCLKRNLYVYFEATGTKQVANQLSELQIREGIESNSKIIFLISQRKHMLWPLIRTVSARRF